ncbi:Translocation and assembly module TamB [Candidatus Trichorickettsia mobilis]|uniref:Translocation and assembly module TamB n=1 Tax=Candidatus Trichorickettsia mobilis TaxID=1346319 RepID=A0ABZ0UVN8_9RICK|nr:translocation/assembly module TamB domain-containing protein [Candidatus Trichorickettsia mobilis]WPY00984.1 Translocation and assembly module TamB [Candidatus Trichorickettsia mobilis]
MTKNKEISFYFTKLLMRSIAYSGGILLLIILGLGFWLNTNHAKEQISSLIINSVNENLGYNIELESLEFKFPLKLHLKSMKLSDHNGLWFIAKNMQLGISPTTILSRKLVIDELTLKYIELIRIPEKVDIGASSTDEAVDISISNINILNAVISEHITGLSSELALAITGNLLWQGAEKNLTFNLDSLFEHYIKLHTSGNYSIKNQQLIFDNLSLNFNNTMINGSSSINFTTEMLNGQYTVYTNIFHKLVEEIEENSTLEGKLTLAGTIKAPELTASLQTKNVKYKDTFIPDILWTTIIKYNRPLTKLAPVEQVLEAHGAQNRSVHKVREDSSLGATTQLSTGVEFHKRSNEQKLSGELTATTTLKDISVKTDFVLGTDNLIYFNNIVADADYVTAKGQAVWNKSNNLINGNIKIVSDDLSTLSTFLPIPLKGKAVMEINMAAPSQVQACTITANIEQLLTPSIQASKTLIDIKASDLWKLKLEKAKIEFREADVQGRIFDHLLLEVTELNNRWNLSILGKTKEKHHAFNLKALISLLLKSAQEFSSSISNITGNYGEHKITSDQLMNFAYDHGKLFWEIKKLKLDNGFIAGDGQLTENKIDATLIFEEIPILGLPLTIYSPLKHAKAHGKLKFTDSLLAPQFTGNVKVTNIDLANTVVSDSIMILDAKLIEQLLHINLKITSKNIAALTGELTVPVKASLSPFLFEMVRDEKIKGTLALDTLIEPFTRAYLPVIHQLTGSLSGHLHLNGSLNYPKLDGILTFANGSYIYDRLGLKLQNIHGIFKANNGVINIDEFKAQDNQGNKLLSTAKIMLNKSDKPFEVILVTNGFNLLNHPNVRGAVKADLAIKGNNAAAKASGAIEVGPLEITIPDQFKNDIPTLNIVETIPHPIKKELTNSSFLSTYPLSMQISISTKSQVFVRGWGLNAELGGQLKVKGTIDQPNIEGKLQVIRGRYQEFGKQWNLKEGSLIFEGDIPPSPYLNIKGITTTENIEISPVLSGPLLTPTLAIESSPILPQEEILSIVLFGKESKNISAFQAIQLANNLKRLSGHGSAVSFDPISSARKLLGVDDIKVKTNKNELGHQETAVGVGKYLTDKVYFEIERGMQAGTGKGRIEVEITNHLFIESSSGGNDSNSIGVNWRKDY